MAFDTKGLIELENKLYGLQQDTTDLKKQLLDVGGKKTTEIWKTELAKNTMPNGTLQFWLRYRGEDKLSKVWYRSRSTGAMYRNTTYTTLTSLTDIYPQNSVKRGRVITRNATKAFVLNYGRKRVITKSMIPKNFMPEIDEGVASKAIPEMQDAFNEYLKLKGLI